MNVELYLEMMGLVVEQECPEFGLIWAQAVVSDRGKEREGMELNGVSFRRSVP